MSSTERKNRTPFSRTGGRTSTDRQLAYFGVGFDLKKAFLFFFLSLWVSLEQVKVLKRSTHGGGIKGPNLYSKTVHKSIHTVRSPSDSRGAMCGALGQDRDTAWCVFIHSPPSWNYITNEREDITRAQPSRTYDVKHYKESVRPSVAA